jgi:hypothetical protein
MKKLAAALLIAATLLTGCAQSTTPQDVATADQVLADAYAQQRSGLQVTGEGVVTRVLSDDNEGGRHQRFILALTSGQTLLVAHNIDIAPRIPSLSEGDSVKFSGVYEWNDEGGVIHWTHRDPDGSHQPGWLEHDGLLYQ